MYHNAPNIKLFPGRKMLLTAAVSALAGSLLFAAPQPAPLINPMGSRSASVPRGEGLDSLDDSKLGAELGSRGIGNLLDYYFKVNRIPESDQRAIKTVGALNELRDKTKTIPYGEKLRRVREVADGIDAVLPTLNDPLMMMTTAATIMEFGVNQDVNSLEYWGEDPVTQAQLKPMASAVVKLLDTASKVAQQQADALATRLTGGNDPNADKWEKLDGFAKTAAYSKQMSVYFEALATPVKDPARKKMSDDAITALKDFDSPDSGVQARIRNMLAKLAMVSGDFTTAKSTFVSVYEDKSKVVPPPNPFEQYEARYFAVVTDILNKDLPSAAADKAALDTWQTQEFPKLLAGIKLAPDAIAASQKSIGAAGEMLQWRVHVLEGDLAKPGSPEKSKADSAAEAVLIKLSDSHPELKARIDQQLVNRMPANKVIDDKVPTSLLLALVQKAMGESYKTDLEKPDPVVINKGIEAAHAVMTRKDPNITAQGVSSAQLSIAILLDRLNKKVEAINAYLDYAIAMFKAEPKKATEAFDRAGYMVFDLKKQAVQPVGFETVYNRFLPVAIDPPFNHKTLAYLYAEQLRATRNYKDALKYYRLVPKDDPAYGAAAFKQMIVLDNLLDTKLEPAEHAEAVKEMKVAAAEVKRLYESSTDQYERKKAVQAVLMLADLARIEDKDADTTLKVLEGFETLIKGLPGEEDLIRSANNARLNARIAKGQSDIAVALLTKLLESSKGDQGIAQVRALLDQLDKEYKKADIVHDVATMRSTAKNEAMLTHYLVDWSNPGKGQKDPKISQFYYAYVAFDATQQRVAGGLAENPAERKALLQKAADQYRYLQSPEMHRLYNDTPAVKKRIADKEADPSDVDPNVAAGLALTSFDLGDYLTARDQLDVLIANKKLGMPQVQVIDEKTGEPLTKDNDLYWECTFKYIKSAHEVAKNDPKLDEVAAKNLKNILIRGGIPDRWKDDFDGLTKDMIPGFNPAILAAPQKPATPPTSKPSGGPTAAAPPALFAK